MSDAKENNVRKELPANKRGAAALSDPATGTRGPQAKGEDGYRGSEFDPVGDACAQMDKRSQELNRRMRELLGEEDELLEDEYTDDENPYDGAFASQEPMSDLSDEVAGQIEGVFAEQLGMPEITQEVDAEEASYMEKDAAYAREHVLEETHDTPDAHGYSGKHLAQAVRELTDSESEQRPRPRGNHFARPKHAAMRPEDEAK